MAKHDQKPGNKNGGKRKPDEQTKYDHADANRPDGLQTSNAEIRIEGKRKVYKCYFHKNKPQASCDQEET